MTMLYLAAAPPSEVSALIVEILEEWYFDGIETLVSAELQGDKIVGEFTDRVGLRSVKRFRYEISEEAVEYELLNPEAVQGFSVQLFKKPLFGKGSRAGQKKNCVKGVPCGDSCQQAGRNCSKKPGSATKNKIKKVVSLLDAKLAKGDLEGALKQASWELEQSMAQTDATIKRIRESRKDSKTKAQKTLKKFPLL